MISRPLADSDIVHVVAHMRAADAREAEALAFDPSREAIAQAYLASRSREIAGWALAAQPGGPAIAMIGLWLVMPRVVQCQMVATDEWQAIAPAATRFCMYTVLPFLDAAGMNRAFCMVQEDHDVARRWLARLGFRSEGAHPGFGDQAATYLTYARLRPGLVRAGVTSAERA